MFCLFIFGGILKSNTKPGLSLQASAICFLKSDNRPSNFPQVPWVSPIGKQLKHFQQRNAPMVKNVQEDFTFSSRSVVIDWRKVKRGGTAGFSPREDLYLAVGYDCDPNSCLTSESLRIPFESMQTTEL